MDDIDGLARAERELADLVNTSEKQDFCSTWCHANNCQKIYIMTNSQEGFKMDNIEGLNLAYIRNLKYFGAVISDIGMKPGAILGHGHNLVNLGL